MTRILDVEVNFDITKKELLSALSILIAKNNFSLISTTNAEFILDAQNDKEFKDIINHATYSIPDGIGPWYANEYIRRFNELPKNAFLFFRALWLGLSIGITRNNLYKNRIVGRELIYDLCDLAENNNYSIFLLGGWEKDKWGRSKPTSGNIAEKAAVRLRERYPNLKIVGYTSEFKRDAGDDEKTLNFIHQRMKEQDTSQIEILFVAYNHRWQEKWILRNASKIPAKICLGVGGTLDYVAGNYKTPDELYSKYNLEWLYKLFVQPWRFKRVLKVFPVFPIKVFINSLRSY